METDEEEVHLGFMYAGLPGAGKTTAAEMAAGMTDSSYIETGDIVRAAAEDEGVDTSDGEALGEYAAQGREEFGDGFVSQKLVGMMLQGKIDVEWPLHLSGVRHVKGAIELREYLSTSCLVLVEAPFETRLERLRERGREGEDEFDAIQLLQRDSRELNELGTATIVSSNQVDAKITNDGSLEDLREELKETLSTYGAF